MIRTSGIITYFVSALPRDEYGYTLPGLVQVTLEDHPLPVDEQYSEPRHVYESEPGRTIDDLPGTPASVEIIGQPWTPEAMALLYPVASTYCMNAEWLEVVTEGGETYTARRRDRQILVPQGVTPIKTNIPSHIWAKDRE